MNSREGPQRRSDEHAVEKATALIRDGKLADAELLLRDYVSRMPKSWRPLAEEPQRVIGFFWSQLEFMTFIGDKRPKKSVIWALGSYSRAYYLLAYIASERHNWAATVEEVEKGLALEPDHPELLCEKALALGFLGRAREAYELHRNAATIREWATRPQRAKALRGAATSLIDLGNLDKAEELLRESLRYEPESPGARREINYIAALRNGGQQSPRMLFT